MEKHILKYFLIFNLYCLFTFNVYSQDADSLNEESSRSIVINDNQETIYPGKPLLMSLVLPGAGQYYNKAPKWKTAFFFGTELISILSWNYFKNTAETYENDYRSFADQNWSLENWVYNRFNSVSPEWANVSALNSLIGTHDLNLVVSNDLANDLNITGTISSDSLESHPEWFYSGDVTEVRDRHFYENIGKYDQFVGGWADARNEWYKYDKILGDSTETVIKTPKKQKYIDDRYEANQMLNYAKYSITTLMFNHVISGIESVWFSQKKAKENLQEISHYKKINLVYDPMSPIGVGGINLLINF
tara:strand:+ start:3142 stop:4053 length:912 start_codon:yes stop_codon:yes gene_type:complete